MTKPVSSKTQYFTLLEGPYQHEKPCIPDKNMLLEIPQNLPHGTVYNIGLQQEEEKTVGDKINTVNQKLNNFLEINSLILLKQIPDLHQELEQIKQTLENVKKTLNIKIKKEPLTIKPPIIW